MKRSPANLWHAAVFGETNYVCESEAHHPDCDGFASEAHHVVYRWRLRKEALWLRANGIALSKECHMLAHSSHNASLSEHRLAAAVSAVNKVQGHIPGFHIAPFFAKGYAMERETA